MKVVVCNAGSSSLKVSVFDPERQQLLATASIDWTTQPTQVMLQLQGQPEIRKEVRLRNFADATTRILNELQAGSARPLHGLSDVGAVGHRVVHGGERYTAAVRITSEVQRVIGELAELAPLHNPASLEVIRAVDELLPRVPQVAVFDTAFHATLPEAARTYPVPREWTRDWGVRRYGFHGLSHSYCAQRAADMMGGHKSRIIIAHLGSGASVSAVNDGICVDTSMGFTPLEGLMMGTRSGTVDPGMLIYLMQQKGMDADQLSRALNWESGLLGVSGISSDMRQVLAAVPHNPFARLAIDVYVHRVRHSIGAMAATLGGVDALVFTAGIGEHSAEIRQRVCEKLGYMGVELDVAANEVCKPDADIAMSGSPRRILVIATREDATVARETWRLITAEVQAAARPVAA